MTRPLDLVIWHSTLLAWLIALGVSVAVYVALYVVLRIVRGRVAAFAVPTQTLYLTRPPVQPSADLVSA